MVSNSDKSLTHSLLSIHYNYVFHMLNAIHWGTHSTGLSAEQNCNYVLFNAINYWINTTIIQFLSL